MICRSKTYTPLSIFMTGRKYIAFMSFNMQNINAHRTDEESTIFISMVRWDSGYNPLLLGNIHYRLMRKYMLNKLAKAEMLSKTSVEGSGTGVRLVQPANGPPGIGRIVTVAPAPSVSVLAVML